MGLWNRLLGRPSELPLLSGSDSVTLKDSRPGQRALKLRAKREGWTLPEKVGERFGFSTRVVVVEDKTQPDGWRNVVRFEIGGIVVDTWVGEEATPLLKELHAAGVNAAELDAVMYRGQGGVWRVRVRV